MSGQIRSLPRHFVNNWWQRVGGVPTLPMVRSIIKESVKIQHCMDLLDRCGNTRRQLAIYWHTGLRIIITVDHISGLAVSVFTETMAS